MNHPYDTLYQDRTWFDQLGAWLAERARRWRPRQPARLWSVGFALFAALCVAWAAALATQCVLMEMPRNVCAAQWLAAGLLLVAARHFLAVTGLSAASANALRQRSAGCARHTWSADAAGGAPTVTPAAPPPRTSDPVTAEGPQQFFRAVKAAGINVRIAQALYAAGFRSAQQVRAADDQVLLATPGIGPATLRKLRARFGRTSSPPAGAQSRAA